MALLPEIHVNVGELTYERIYQFFLPLASGATFVAGVVLNNPTYFSEKADAFRLSAYFSVALLVCAAYVVGLVLYGISLVISGNCTIALNQVLYKKWPPRRENSQAASSLVFRRVASEFLGPSLTPPMAMPALTGSDVEWQDLYNILQDYVLRKGITRVNEALLFYLHLEAVGLALTYLYFRTYMWHHWWVLAICFLTVLQGAFAPGIVNYVYWKFDRLSGWDFVARLIGEIRKARP
jgi:hypothetical protein